MDKDQVVQMLADRFWYLHCKHLDGLGLTQEDTRQQAWVVYVKQKTVWPTNPTKYIPARLVDWMRAASHYRRRIPANALKAEVLFWEHVPEVAFTVDVETPDIIRKARAAFTGRNAFVFERNLEGYTKVEIAEMLGVTGGRIGQIYGGLVSHMKKILLVAALFALVLSGVPVWAQTVPVMIGGCTGVSWDANTEADLAGYKIYVEKDGVWQTPVDAGPTETSAKCADLPMTEGSRYGVNLTAYDNATPPNESLPSVAVSFDWPDVSAPATVSTICWDVVEIVVDSATGKVISSTPKTICP